MGSGINKIKTGNASYLLALSIFFHSPENALHIFGMHSKSEDEGGALCREGQLHKRKRTHKKTLLFHKIFLLGICFFLAGAWFSALAEASLACGQVNSTEGMEPQWMKVKVYGLNKNSFTTCSVSPAENKFCCDIEAIYPPLNLPVGSKVYGEITDEKYFTEPVSLNISGEGYNVFPLMSLKKAITLNNFSKIVLSSEPKILLNASFKNPFANISIERQGQREFLYSGEEFHGSVNASFGMNYFKIIAGNAEREFSEGIAVALLKALNIERAIECEKCSNKLIKSDKEAVITLNLLPSHEIKGLELREYVPKEFKILETGGQVKEYSPTHNVIIWNVSGKIISKAYKVKAPKISFFPRKYVFRAELEELLLREDKITVSRFFSFWSFDEGIELKQVRRQVYSRVSPSAPLVYKIKGKEITRIAVFPKKTINGAEFIAEEYEEGELNKEAENVNYYSFNTNIATEDIEKIFVEFKVPENNSGNFSLYVFENGWEEWDRLKIEFSREENGYFYYQAYIPAAKKIALAGEESAESQGNFLRIFG